MHFNSQWVNLIGQFSEEKRCCQKTLEEVVNRVYMHKNGQTRLDSWKLPELEESCSIDNRKHFRSLPTSAEFFSEEVRRGETEVSFALLNMALPVLL